MKTALIAFFFLTMTFPLFSGDKTLLKEEILALEKKIPHLSLQDKGKKKAELAALYYEDQDQEKALQTFLDALQDFPLSSEKQREITADEAPHYQQALALYLNQNSGQDVEGVARQLLACYLPMVEKNPSFIHINFLIAAAYANLGDFPTFFRAFVSSYSQDPDHYMAYRTKAILHLKLHEKVRSSVEREQQRKEIYENINEALKRNSRDITLYKLKILFSADADRFQSVQTSLQKILDENIIPPRIDLLFYTKEAVDSHQKELAKRFLSKAHEWYPYSRQLNTAQELVDKAP